MGDDELVYQTVLDVRWGDMDALGHLNNAAYFTYMEQARAEWLRELGYPLAGGAEGLVIVTAQCTFRRAVTFPARVRVDVYAAAPGRSSFSTRYVLRDAVAPEQLYAEGGATAVWVDHAAERSRPLPDGLRSRLPGTGGG